MANLSFSGGGALIPRAAKVKSPMVPGQTPGIQPPAPMADSAPQMATQQFGGGPMAGMGPAMGGMQVKPWDQGAGPGMSRPPTDFGTMARAEGGNSGGGPGEGGMFGQRQALAQLFGGGPRPMPPQGGPSFGGFTGQPGMGGGTMAPAPPMGGGLTATAPTGMRRRPMYEPGIR